MHTVTYIHTVTDILLHTYCYVPTVTYILFRIYCYIHTVTYILLHTYCYIHTVKYILLDTYCFTQTVTYLLLHTYCYIHTVASIHPSIHTYIQTHTRTYIHTYMRLCVYTYGRYSLWPRFAVTQQGLVRISGHWAAGGREILPEQQAAFDVSSLAVIIRCSCPAYIQPDLVLVDCFMNCILEKLIWQMLAQRRPKALWHRIYAVRH